MHATGAPVDCPECTLAPPPGVVLRTGETKRPPRARAETQYWVDTSVHPLLEFCMACLPARFVARGLPSVEPQPTGCPHIRRRLRFFYYTRALRDPYRASPHSCEGRRRCCVSQTTMHPSCMRAPLSTQRVATSARVCVCVCAACRHTYEVAPPDAARFWHESPHTHKCVCAAEQSKGDGVSNNISFISCRTSNNDRVSAQHGWRVRVRAGVCGNPGVQQGWMTHPRHHDDDDFGQQVG
jgi:hypothetical protein